MTSYSSLSVPSATDEKTGEYVEKKGDRYINHSECPEIIVSPLFPSIAITLPLSFTISIPPSSFISVSVSPVTLTERVDFLQQIENPHSWLYANLSGKSLNGARRFYNKVLEKGGIALEPYRRSAEYVKIRCDIVGVESVQSNVLRMPRSDLEKKWQNMAEPL